MTLSSSDWVRLNQLLDEALDLDPNRRASWIDALAAEDRKMADTLRGMLLRHSRPRTRDILPAPPLLEDLPSGTDQVESQADSRRHARSLQCCHWLMRLVSRLLGR